MRRLAGVLAVLALLGASGAGQAAPEKRYLKVAATASFHLELDYGNDPRAVYNGKFEKYTDVFLRAIAVFDGSKVSLLPGASMVLEGKAFVSENRSQWVSPTSRKPVTCKKSTADVRKVVFTKRGRVSVTSDGLTIDPGTAIKPPPCTATEELENHGLPGGPSFTVSAPAKSRFTGTQRFSVACYDSYKHPFTLETDGNGHAFTGESTADVRFTPFPATSLTDVKRELRDYVGKGLAPVDGGRPKDCLR